MPRNITNSTFMKPFVVLALPGMYLFYKYNQYKRQQQEQNRRKVAERELVHLNHKIDKLLTKLEEHEPEIAATQDEECVICVNAKATMQTYPCGHRVVCRKCFVKTIQVAVSQRLLPLRCVICRAKILRLKQGHGVLMPTSASQYCMGVVPPSASLYSMSSGASTLSGVSTVSSASSASCKSGKCVLPAVSRIPCRQPTGCLRRSQTQAMKACKETTPLILPPQIRIQEYKEPRSGRMLRAEPPPQRLPPIREFQREFAREFRSGGREKPSGSTRIRCAQKIVTQLETTPSKGQKSHRSRSPLKSTRKEEKRKDDKSEKRKDEKSEKRKDDKSEKRKDEKCEKKKEDKKKEEKQKKEEKKKEDKKKEEKQKKEEKKKEDKKKEDKQKKEEKKKEEKKKEEKKKEEKKKEKEEKKEKKDKENNKSEKKAEKKMESKVDKTENKKNE